MQFTAHVTREDDQYVAQCLEVDVASQGDTAEEAVAHLKEALALYYEDEDLAKLPERPRVESFEVAIC